MGFEMAVRSCVRHGCSVVEDVDEDGLGVCENAKRGKRRNIFDLPPGLM